MWSFDYFKASTKCRQSVSCFLRLFSANEKEQADRGGHAVWYVTQNTHQEKTRRNTHTWKISQGVCVYRTELSWFQHHEPHRFPFHNAAFSLFSWIPPPVLLALHPTRPCALYAILHPWDHLSLPAGWATPHLATPLTLWCLLLCCLLLFQPPLCPNKKRLEPACFVSHVWCFWIVCWVENHQIVNSQFNRLTRITFKEQWWNQGRC